MMSLGAGALKVSGGPNAISREEVSMATLDCAVTGFCTELWNKLKLVFVRMQLASQPVS